MRLLSRTRGTNKLLARASSSASGAHQFVPQKYAQQPTATMMVDTTNIPVSRVSHQTTTSRIATNTNQSLKQQTNTADSLRQKFPMLSRTKHTHKYDYGQNFRPKLSQKKPMTSRAQQHNFSNYNDMFGPGMTTAGSFQRMHRRAYVVDNVSRWIFPLSFIVLNIFYWAYYLELIDGLKAFYHDRIQFW